MRGRRNIIIGQRVSSAKAERARELRRDMTAAEALLWSRLRRNGVGLHFRRQQVIDGFIADFYCHAAGLVVEVDGPVHEASYDEERDAILQDRGLAVVRFSNEDVLHGLDQVMTIIRQHAHSLASRGSRAAD